MLFFIDFIVALLAAVIIGILFFALFRSRKRQTGGGNRSLYIIFFLLLILAGWAGGIWIPSFGPTAWNVYWIPFFIAALLFALFLIAFLPGQPATPSSPDSLGDGRPPGGDQERKPEAPAAPQAITPRPKLNRDKTEENSVSLSAKLFLGALLVLFVLAIIARYLWFYEEVLP